MMTDNTKRGIAIVTGIANTAHAVNQTFSKEQLNQLLAVFDHHPGGVADAEYVLPEKLILWAYNTHYAISNDKMAELIREVFSWFTPPIDRSLLD
jgi:hypothetical protein